MGIDLHNLALLGHAQDRGASFGRTVGIGRQALFVDPPELETHRTLRGLPPLARAGVAGRLAALLRAAAAAVVRRRHGRLGRRLGLRAGDRAARHEPALARRQAGLGSYDAVLDFGCLEHVFDFPVAWRNCVALCRVGGHLFHSLPANNLAGHGFYQFSPELFFNLYQAKNGFELRRPLARDEGRPAALVEGRRSGRGAAPGDVAQRARGLHAGAREEARPRSARAAAAAVGLRAERVAEGAARRGRRGRSRRRRRRSGPAGRWPRSACSTPPRRGRERLRALRESGLALPAPDYQRIDVADLLRRRPPPMSAARRRCARPTSCCSARAWRCPAASSASSASSPTRSSAAA